MITWRDIEASTSVNDTSPEFARIVAARYAAMSVQERFEIVCSMRQTAIAIIESSLPPSLTREQRRYDIAKHMYEEELPEAALWAHAYWPDKPPKDLSRTA